MTCFIRGHRGLGVLECVAFEVYWNPYSEGICQQHREGPCICRSGSNLNPVFIYVLSTYLTPSFKEAHIYI